MTSFTALPSNNNLALSGYAPKGEQASTPRYAGTPSNQDKENSARFGACDPCSCPCTCLSALLTAGAFAAAGLGLIKLSPKIVSAAKKLFTPENTAKLKGTMGDWMGKLNAASPGKLATDLSKALPPTVQ
jgi:hypothetical protein